MLISSIDHTLIVIKETPAAITSSTPRNIEEDESEQILNQTGNFLHIDCKDLGIATQARRYDHASTSDYCSPPAYLDHIPDACDKRSCQLELHAMDLSAATSTPHLTQYLTSKVTDTHVAFAVMLTFAASAWLFH